ARPLRLDSVPSDSVCAVAGSLDTFTNPISARRTQLSRFKRLPVTQEVAGLASPIAPAFCSYGSAVSAVADWNGPDFRVDRFRMNSNLLKHPRRDPGRDSHPSRRDATEPSRKKHRLSSGLTLCQNIRQTTLDSYGSNLPSLTPHPAGCQDLA